MTLTPKREMVELAGARMVVDEGSRRLVEVSYTDREGKRTRFVITGYRPIEEDGPSRRPRESSGNATDPAPAAPRPPPRSFHIMAPARPGRPRRRRGAAPGEPWPTTHSTSSRTWTSRRSATPCSRRRRRSGTATTSRRPRADRARGRGDRRRGGRRVHVGQAARGAQDEAGAPRRQPEVAALRQDRAGAAGGRARQKIDPPAGDPAGDREEDRRRDQAPEDQGPGRDPGRHRARLRQEPRRPAGGRSRT